MSDTSAPRGFWSRKVLGPIRAQLTQGASPERLALGLSIGCGLGVFPILGSSTLLCIGVGASMRLNQPVVQLGNWLATAAQIPLILAFVRLGEFLTAAPPMPIVPTQLVTRFQDSPAAFLSEFGRAGLHGILGWTVAIPVVLLAVYPVLRWALQKVAGNSDPNPSRGVAGSDPL